MDMLKAGLNVTLNTDDPEISGIILSDEYYMVCSVLKLSREALKDRIIAARWRGIFAQARTAQTGRIPARRTAGNLLIRQLVLTYTQ